MTKIKISKKAIEEVKNLRLADEKYENEKRYDTWFKNLTILQKADLAEGLWDEMDYKNKKIEYELE